MAWSDAARAAAKLARNRGKTPLGRLDNFARRQLKLMKTKPGKRLAYMVKMKRKLLA